ncbi:MAG: S8 family serine peptidase [Polyangiaceae bacterium]|nr:S8 family serine peptidase [Polyangiaceae bacterium]
MKARRWSLVSSSLVVGALVASCTVDGDNAGVSEPSTLDAAPTGAQAPLLGTSAPGVIAGSYIVVFKDNVPAAAMGVTKGRVAATGLSRVTREYTVIPGFAAQLGPTELEALRNDPSVAYIEADREVHLDATFPSPADGVDRVDQRSLPRDGQYNDFGCNGSGVHVYIVDTGLNAAHNEFTGRVGNNFDSVGDGQNGNDCDGHGSHVASTAAGTQFGMAKQATIHASRVLNCAGSGTIAGVIAGVDFVKNDCTANGRKCVANMSLGGGAAQTLDDAVTAAVNAGIPFVVAAGNESTNACTRSPARTPLAITVGATDDNDIRASFSNFGPCVDIFAPGVSILGANIGSPTATQSISGTSMASPHVAGAVAQFLSCNPTANPQAALNALLANASNNCVTNPGTGSPNIFLHNNFNAGSFTCGGGGSGGAAGSGGGAGSAGKAGAAGAGGAGGAAGAAGVGGAGGAAGSGGKAGAGGASGAGAGGAAGSGGGGPNSCVGFCDQKAPGGCFCDDECQKFGDCCADKVAVCGGAPRPPAPDSCEGRCGQRTPDGCWCDEQCEKFGDCCDDKPQFCE